ncbi:DUF1311 domain-containing protein, partial [Salmonella enterica]|nr:DUF1311 domain-containing protein [Salmonella enterica]
MKNILLASLLVASPAAFAASFDCQKASTEVEHKICDNERLSKLDEQLSSTYSIALKANPGDADTLKTVQRQWINMRGKLTDDKALELVYLIQINGLKGLDGSASTAVVNETPKPVQKQPEVQEKTSKADAKQAKSGDELTLESFRAKYIEVDGEYYSTTSLPRGSSFLFTCASR